MRPVLHFLGAARTVTGSKFLLEAGGKRVLIDCGLFQGQKELRLRNWSALPVDPKSIDAVVLTHAHIDHTGYLPRLLRQGFRGPVFCTPATRDLSAVMLPDSGHLQEEEARFANKKGYSKHSPAEPLYTKEEAERAVSLIEALDYGQEAEVARGVRLRLHPTGHILGAAFAELKVDGTRLVVSGDVGGYDGEIMRDPAPIPAGADYVAVESTYGGRSSNHRPIREQLRDRILPVVKAGGIVVVPAFAVGRTSLILFHLRKLQESRELPEFPVYVDSPMATDAVKLYAKHVDEHNIRPELVADSLRTRRTVLVRSAEDSKRLNDLAGPAVVISASGMATGGRVLHHLKHKLPDPKNMVLLVGFQAVGTRGRTLLEGAERVKLLGEEVPVRAKVAAINGLSAHGDSDDMIRWLATARAKPKAVFLVHGEPEALAAMGQRVDRELGMRHHAPDYLEQVPL